MKKLLSLLTAVLLAGTMFAANAKVGDVLWSEDFSGFAENANPSGTIANSHTGTSVYNSGSVTYATVAGSDSRPKIFTSGGPSGGSGNNLLIYKKNGYFSISGIPTGGATEITLAYLKGGSGTLVITGSDNIEIDGTTITVNSGTSFDLTFKNTNNNNNLRLDNVSVTVKTAGVECNYNVTISKGTPSNGDFTLNKTGELPTCGGALEVIVSPTPAEHYKVSSITAPNSSSISEPDEDGKYTITYAQNTNASSAINVIFAIKDQFDVTWNVNGATSTTKVYEGEKPVFPATPAAFDATSTTFYGWAATSWSGKIANLSEKTVYTIASAMPVVNGAVTYYAVFAKAAEGSAPVNEVLLNEEFENLTADNVPTGPSANATVYGGVTITYVCTDGGSTTKIYAQTLAGGSSPELLVSKTNGSFAMEGISTGKATALELTYYANNDNLALTTSENASAGEVSVSENVHTAIISITSGDAFDLTFSNAESGNTRLDNIKIIVETPACIDFITTAVVPSALDNTSVDTKAVKVLRDGVLFIEKAGKTYNAQGQLVK